MVFYPQKNYLLFGMADRGFISAKLFSDFSTLAFLGAQDTFLCTYNMVMCMFHFFTEFLDTSNILFWP